MFHKIDADGLFVEDYIGEQPVVETGEPDPLYIAVPVPEGFYWPRWDGEKWVEGGTPPEPVPPEPTIEERLAAVEAATLDLILGVSV